MEQSNPDIKIEDMTDDEIDAILHNILTGKEDNEAIIETLTPEQFMAAMMQELPTIPMLLQERLDTLQFDGDFSTLNIMVDQALAMDLPTLARHINEVTGISKAFAEQRERETIAKNRKFLTDRANTSRFG